MVYQGVKAPVMSRVDEAAAVCERVCSPCVSFCHVSGNCFRVRVLVRDFVVSVTVWTALPFLSFVT